MRLQSVENQETGRSLLPLLTHSTNGLKWLASKSVTFSVDLQCLITFSFCTLEYYSVYDIGTCLFQFSATKRVKTRCFKWQERVTRNATPRARKLATMMGTPRWSLNNQVLSTSSVEKRVTVKRVRSYALSSSLLVALLSLRLLLHLTAPLLLLVVVLLSSPACSVLLAFFLDSWPCSEISLFILLY